VRVCVDISCYQGVQRNGNGDAIDGSQDENAPCTQSLKGGNPGGNLQENLGSGRQQDIVREAVMG
jgi:hypothetical protein